MVGTREGSRLIAEGKEKILELKQSLTHQLDSLGTVPIQHCLQGFVSSKHFLGKDPPGYFWGYYQSTEESLYQLVQFHFAL